MKRFLKALKRIPITGLCGKIFSKLASKKFLKYLISFYRSLGIDIQTKQRFIAADVSFDSSDYSLIHIGKLTTISKEVMFLTHDFCIGNALYSIGKENFTDAGSPCFLREIQIGDNCFIGARVVLLPGTQ